MLIPGVIGFLKAIADLMAVGFGSTMVADWEVHASYQLTSRGIRFRATAELVDLARTGAPERSKEVDFVAAMELTLGNATQRAELASRPDEPSILPVGRQFVAGSILVPYSAPPATALTVSLYPKFNDAAFRAGSAGSSQAVFRLP